MVSPLKEKLASRNYTKLFSAYKIHHFNNGLILEKNTTYSFCNNQVMYKHDYEQYNAMFLLLLQQPPCSRL